MRIIGGRRPRGRRKMQRKRGTGPGLLPVGKQPTVAGGSVLGVPPTRDEPPFFWVARW